MNKIKSPVIVALDFNTEKEAIKFLKQLDSQECRVKIGKELFTTCGPSIVESIQKLGFEVFLDLKFHDIPNTTAQAVVAAAKLGVWMVNIHAMAGNVAMQTCVERLQDYQTKLIAVTILTSMDANQLSNIGITKPIPEMVMNLAQLTYDNGLDGVVCSAQEAIALRQQLGDDFLLVTPGIRMASDSADDQKRICTPKQALLNGASHLVIGRSITKADDPQVALSNIINSMN